MWKGAKTDMENRNKQQMFKEYPDVVGVSDLREMLGGISKKLAYKLLSQNEIHSIRIGREYKIPKCDVVDYLLREEMCQIKIS